MSISLPHLYRGKVRDLYDAGDDRILMVASDRISVFDVVLPDDIPDKGRVLTAISTCWCDLTADLLPNHVLSVDPADFPDAARPDADGRATLVRRTEPVRMECIARGYLCGSAWKEYREAGTVQGRPMPAGMQEAEALPEPMCTFTTKADEGHDLPMTEAEAIEIVGADAFDRLRGVALANYAPGGSPASFDKQFVRDHYLATGWDQTPPAPPVPPDVVAGTRERYIEAYERITGRDFADWYGPGSGAPDG